MTHSSKECARITRIEEIHDEAGRIRRELMQLCHEIRVNGHNHDLKLSKSLLRIQCQKLVKNLLKRNEIIE